jgi:excisionase family DNA binding protein
MKIFPLVQREGLSILEAASLAGLGRTKIYECIKDGSLPARKHGRRTIILRRDVIEFLEALPATTTPTQTAKSRDVI